MMAVVTALAAGLAAALAMGWGGTPGTGTLPEDHRVTTSAPYLVMLAFHARPGLHLGVEVDGEETRLVSLDASTGAIEELTPDEELPELLAAVQMP